MITTMRAIRWAALGVLLEATAATAQTPPTREEGVARLRQLEAAAARGQLAFLPRVSGNEMYFEPIDAATLSRTLSGQLRPDRLRVVLAEAVALGTESRGDLQTAIQTLQQPVPTTAVRPGQQRAQAFDLTGLWHDEAGGIAYRVRQVGNRMYWTIDRTGIGSNANLAFGDISGNTWTGTWIDLPGSREMNVGSLTLRIESNDRFVKVASNPYYGASVWTRVGSTTTTTVTGLANEYTWESAGNWRGTWRRRGDQNVFDSQVQGPNGERVAIVEQVTLQGQHLHAQRLSSSDGTICSVDADRQPDGSYVGTGSCPSSSSGWFVKLTPSGGAGGPGSLGGGGGSASAVGTWTWFASASGEPAALGHNVIIRADGTMSYDGGASGTWTQSGAQVTLRWTQGISAGGVDNMTISADGRTLNGRNLVGWNVRGIRQ